MPALPPRFVLVLSLLAFLALAGYRLGAPWLLAGGGDEAFAGAQYQAIARHQLAHGLRQTRLAQFRVFHDLTPAELFDSRGQLRSKELREAYGDRFWTSRLPLGALLHTASLALFSGGRSAKDVDDLEWTIRLVPLSATALLILAVYGLMRLRFGE